MLARVVTALAASCGLLGACGGFLEEETAASQDCVFGGVMHDQHAQPLAGVTVVVQLDRPYEALTDDFGRYELTMPAAYAYPLQFAGTATKDSYLPQAVLFNRSGIECPSALSQSLQMRQIVESDVVFPLGTGVTHVGNDVYPVGEFNSQLQVPSIGLKWSDGFVYTDSMKAQFTRLCVSLLARGVQSLMHMDTISLSRASDAAATEILLMSNSDPSGVYTEASYCFSLTPFSPSERIVVSIESGNGGGAVDYDDFEFLSVVGTLLP